MNVTLTRFKAVVLGCSLAAASCLATPGSRSKIPQQCVFELTETLGAWDLLEQRDLQPSALKILQASDHWQRVYQNRETKQIVVATLIAGEGGPLASHMPETCYARNDFCSLSDAIVWTVPERSDKFRFQTLAPRKIDQPAVTIAYAWNDGNQWTAPHYPRIQLAGHTTLQRLLITMRHPNGMASNAREAMQQFVQLAVNTVEVKQARNTPRLNATKTRIDRK